MALDPKLLDSLPNTLVDMYGLVEIDILEDMARRISTYDYFIPAAQHQNQKLQELGMTQEQIIQKLSAMTGQTQREIVDLLSEASAEAVADDLEYYTAAEVYEPSKVNTEALHNQLNSGLLQTQQSFKNITRTTANTATKQFENALDRAWTQINVGGMDYSTAIKNAIVDLSSAGVGSVEYKSGRVDNIEVAVRRAVVTGANQTSMKIQETLADELEVDLVETTAHGGARPNHAKWQGIVFSRKGRVTIDGVTYEDLKKATGYGSAGGLGGVNCRHNFHPYIPGTSRAYTDEQLKELDKKKINYNGEPYTEYEASQIQRGIERDIRAAKRTVAALEAAGLDSSAERKKLCDAQKSYTDFTNQTGFKKQQARTKIATGTGTERPAPSTPTPKQKPKQTERQKPEEQARSLQGDFAKKMNISEDEAKRRFDMFVSSNSDAQLKSFVNKYSKLQQQETAAKKPPLTNNVNNGTIKKQNVAPQINSDKVLEQAKDGRKHKGIYKEAQKKSRSRLQKSIASHEKQVQEHIEKLKNPEKYDADWNNITEQHKRGLLKKWLKDMQRNAEQAEIERRVYNERFGEE